MPAWEPGVIQVRKMYLLLIFLNYIAKVEHWLMNLIFVKLDGVQINIKEICVLHALKAMPNLVKYTVLLVVIIQCIMSLLY